MTLESWLAYAREDATRRGIDGLAPLLDTLVAATRALREADWNTAADVVDVPVTTDRNQDVRITPGPTTAAGTAPVRPRPEPSESVCALAPQLASGELTAREVVERCLARIDALDPSLNAFITVLADDARAEAAACDAERASGRVRGPLHGIPVALKDLIDVRGVPTTAASHVRQGLVARADATVARRLREAGAIFIGKTNLHEFAFGTTNEDSAFGAAHHPSDPSRSPGGSSGGSAIAVRTGMSVAALGTDTGGSVRIPAAACGLVGLKPTFGEIPTEGVVPLADSLDSVGPIAQTVSDAWLLCDVLRARGPSRPRDVARLAGLRVAVLEPYFCDLLDAGVLSAYGAALERLAGAGVHIVRASIPHAALIAPVYLHIVLAEAMAYHASTLDRRPQDYQHAVRVRLELGRYVLGEDYARASRGRAVLVGEVDAMLELADAIALPTLPMAAPLLGASSVMFGTRREPVRNAMLRLTQLFPLTGHPAISLPIGDAEPGLPAGLQLAGRRHQTDRLLAIALACEGAVSS